MLTTFVGARVFDGERFHNDAAVVTEGGKITDVVAHVDAPASGERIELTGGVLAPGFVDVQVNGGGDVLFNSAPTHEAVATIFGAHARFGTTGMTPTLISDHDDVLHAGADAIAECRRRSMPGVLGVHFEGPALSHARRGVHDTARIRSLDDTLIALYTRRDLGQVVVTLAPESATPQQVRALADAGVRVCIGHTDATYDEVTALFDAGATGATHLFNAMSPLTSRAPGAVGAALDHRACWFGMIADGHHVHPTSIRIAHAAASERMMLVTDAMPSVGGTRDSFELHGQRVTVKDGRCTNAEGQLAGSALDMSAAVRKCLQIGITPEQALAMASRHPATFLEGPNASRGRIAPGQAADLVYLNDEWRVTRTWIAGKGVT